MRIAARPLTLILSQPNFPVPAVKDGSSATIISDTLECLPGESLLSLSLRNQKHDFLPYDKKTCLLVNNKSIGFRLLRKVLLQNRRYAEILNGLNSNQQGLLLGLKVAQWLYRPCSVVVHTTKPGWALRVKRLCGSNTKVVGYYHHSEMHLSDPKILAAMVRELDGHIFVSDFAARSFESVGCSLAHRDELNIFVIPNGINPDIFKPATDPASVRRELGIDSNKIVLLFSGRLLPRKGLHCLLIALSKLRDDVLNDLILIVAGSHDFFQDLQTPYISEIHELSSSRSLKGKVIFTGYVPHPQMPRYYQVSDFLVFPSIELEGMPLTVIEAQMSSLPVIASAVGGTPEALIPEVTGFLVDPPGDPTVIAEQIERLVRFPGLRLAMGEKARRFALEFYSRQRMAEDFLQVVRKICMEPA